ncbi:MAG: helix-turn-helix domain-containing protein [Clostridiales bacterium]|nr:helix-turn-helix domain-containing protein [Clostridiales bacterium]
MKTFADSHYLFEKGSPDGVNTFTSPDKFVAHWHRAGEILYLMPSEDSSKIKARVIVGDTLYEITPGDIIFIPGQQIHEVPDGCKGRLYGLQYNTNILSSQSEFLPYIRRFARIAVLRKSDTPELTTYLIAKFEEIRAMNNADERFKRIRSAMILCDCFMSIADYIDKKYSVDDSSVSPSAILAINRVCEYVKDNLTKDPSLENAAKHVGLCTSYLSRTFKQVLGISYTDYVNRNKVSLAISLMASDEYSITEICYLAGFNSISSFNRVFLNVTGLTPRKFRRYNSGQSLNNELQ